MISRKEFIKKGLLLTAAGTVSDKILAGAFVKRKKIIAQPGSTSPVVIATWENLKATDSAMQIIMKGGEALDAVEAGARVPEADPENTSVGYGGLPDRDGYVSLDACIMDHKGNAGSVTYLQDIMHPVSVARKVMENTPHVMLSGDGALQFALSQGFKKENLLTEKSKAKWQEWIKENKYTPVINKDNHDTIGILAIDSENNISGACTTSGWAFKMHGRVGDSPIPGAGMYVDNDSGGACATGTGELVIKICGSFLIVELMRNGRTPQEAVEETIHRMVKKMNVDEMQVGFLALNKKGEYGAYSIRKEFSYSLYKNAENKIFESGYFLK